MVWIPSDISAFIAFDRDPFLAVRTALVATHLNCCRPFTRLLVNDKGVSGVLEPFSAHPCAVSTASRLGPGRKLPLAL